MNALPPYALPPPLFRFRALAAQAGRATLGGTRELLLAALMVARLADGVVGHYTLAASLRRARAAAARTWLATLTLPPAARAVMSRVVDATGSDDIGALYDAWESMLTFITPVLDMPARTELRRVAPLSRGLVT
jgi:hypothetical protein